MPKFTLKVGEERPVATPKAYLNILSASAQFVVESPEIGVLAGKANKQFTMGEYRSVNFVNNTDAPIDIEYEVANIITTSSGEANVNIQNEVVVKRIVEAIQVNASATVEDGKMATNVSDIFLPVPDNRVTISNGQTLEVFAARPALNRLVALQLITAHDDLSKICMSNTQANAANKKGFFLQGNEDAPAGYEWQTETSVWVHNYSGHSITLAGGEMWRA